MLSIAKFNAGAAGAIETYMRGELANGSREDYYTAEGEGKWRGELARDLELEGTVKPGELAAVLEGHHPATGEALAHNAGSSHAPGWDCTFSAPKSVSLEWAFNDDMRAKIEAAHEAATVRALDYLEKNAFTNRDRSGPEAGQAADKIIAATFQHGSSREGDPQLHTHCAVANLVRRQDGTFGAADLDTRHKMAAGTIYRAELAAALQGMGYAVERDGSSFRLAGADRKLETEFSKRAAQINTESKGQSYKAQRNTVKNSRKDKELSPAQLRENWKQAAKDVNYRAIERTPDANAKEAMPLPGDFLNAQFSHASTLTEMQLRAAIFVEAQGKLTATEAERYLQDVKKSSEAVELVADKKHGRGTNLTETRWTSREMFDLEKGLSTRAALMANDRASIGGKAVGVLSLQNALARKPLTVVGEPMSDQEKAFHHITGEGRLAAVQGIAGAGKSYLLDVAREAWQRDGREVVGCALQGKTAEDMERDTGIPSNTIHSTLTKLDKGEIVLSPRSVVVMDEAGMTGSRLMADLQARVDDAGAKLVLVGDVRQIQPVDAGGALREIQGKTGFAEMNEIRRQKDEGEQRMVKDFANGNAERALAHLKEKDRLKAYDTVSEARATAARAVVADMREGKTSIAMADTRAACREMNAAAREEMQAHGMLKGEEKTFAAEVGERKFAENDRVIFLKNDARLGVKNGSTGTVLSAREGELRVRTDKGKTVVVKQTAYNKIDHGYAFTVHKSQGVTVDRAHYAPGQMADRELGYVSASRHRETVTLHAQRDTVKELDKTLSTSHAKGTSQDFREKDLPPVPPVPPARRSSTPERRPLVRRVNDADAIRRDADLAARALDAHKRGIKAPAQNKDLTRALKRGDLAEVRDSRGNRFYTDRKGNTLADSLRAREVKQVKTLTGEHRKLDTKILGLKIGDRIADKRGRDVGMVANVISRTRMNIAERNQQAAAIKELQAKIETARQLGRIEAERTDKMQRDAKAAAFERKLLAEKRAINNGTHRPIKEKTELEKARELRTGRTIRQDLETARQAVVSCIQPAPAPQPPQPTLFQTIIEKIRSRDR